MQGSGGEEGPDDASAKLACWRMGQIPDSTSGDNAVHSYQCRQSAGLTVTQWGSSLTVT